ncbi:molybdate ABC transporter substrate-binding protein [Leptolyngbya sp. AN02str]|uniref:molybdate ABC transporter substrate-binding protein n=1 Tax=Leptolyngbya sp. AN02str TaxID=3423363 RepID=UPI003D319507
MSTKRFLTWFGLFVLTFTLLIACSPTSSISQNSESSPSVTLTVSAAASLQDALEAIDPLFEQSNPTVQVSYNFGSSGALQQQIEQGAPADVFISAAAKQMDALQAKNLLLADTRRNLLANRLALIVPQNSTLNLTDFRQLTDTGVSKIAVGEPSSVPAGQYAEEVLKNLKLAEPLQPKFVFANNVRGVLAAVESGNAEAGIVYATDAKQSDRVKVVAIAEENLHQPIVYPMAVLSSSSNATAAQTYTEFLFDSQAQNIFQQFGFGRPGAQ